MTNSRKGCQSGQTCQPRTLAEAVDCVCHHSAIPLREIAELIGRRESYLRAAASANDDTHAFQASLVAPVTLATGNFAIADLIERQLGRVAVVVPKRDATREDLFVHSTRVLRETAEALDEIRRSLEDNRITPDEHERISLQIDEAHQALAAIAAEVGHLACAAGGRS